MFNIQPITVPGKEQKNGWDLLEKKFPKRNDFQDFKKAIIELAQ